MNNVGDTIASPSSWFALNRIEDFLNLVFVLGFFFLIWAFFVIIKTWFWKTDRINHLLERIASGGRDLDKNQNKGKEQIDRNEKNL